MTEIQQVQCQPEEETDVSWSEWKRNNWAWYKEKCATSCHYCGMDADKADAPLGLDHLVPQSRGGAHDFANLVPCCRSCNSSKGTKTVDEFRADRDMALRRHVRSAIESCDYISNNVYHTDDIMALAQSAQCLLMALNSRIKSTGVPFIGESA